MNIKVIRTFCACALMACVLYLGMYHMQNIGEENIYDELRHLKDIAGVTRITTPTAAPTLTFTPAETPELTEMPEATQAPGATATLTPTDTPSPTPTATPTPTEAVILSQYQDLYDINNDMAGWITIDGTNIDYPVMHIPGETAADSEDYFYLYRNFYKEVALNPLGGKPGSIFIDGRCSVFPDRSDNLMIYGHNMSTSQTMFANLHKFRDKAFYDQYKLIKFDTLYSEDVYEIAYVFIAQLEESEPLYFPFSSSAYIDFKNEATFNAYVEGIEKLQLYDTGVELEYGDQLITLITCTEHSIADGRLVIVARKIQTETEDADDINAEVTDNGTPATEEPGTEDTAAEDSASE